MPAIEIRNVKKRYKSLQALKGVSFTVEDGEFFGLLGPNGAGKTTLISILAGLARADEGSIAVRARPASMLMSVVLPAPFGPSSPKNSPSSTVKLTPLSA